MSVPAIAQPTTTEPRFAYLQRLLDACAVATGAETRADWLQAARRDAIASVREQGIPTTRDEEWRFTDLKPLLEVEFQTATAGRDEAIASLQDVGLMLPEAAESFLVFVNGVYAPRLSSVGTLPEGAFVGNLAEAAAVLDLATYLAQQPDSQETFTALNTAGFQDAAIIHVPKNVVVDAPIHLLFISIAEENPTIHQPRCLLIADRNSACTLIEEYIVAEQHWCRHSFSNSNSTYFTNAVTELYLGENAQVSHIKVQQESTDAFFISKSAIAQARDSRYTSTSIFTGGKLSRHNLKIYQTGEGTQTDLKGLALAYGDQLTDAHSWISLNHPNGSARQLHKCIVGDRAHAVFNGKIIVPQAAQLTDASQLNRNLLLSPKGRVDTKPQLEIVADNVKCSHGATISQLEPDELFYLRSRGLDAATSRNLLIDGFAGEILQQVPIQSLSARLSRCLACRADQL